MRWLIIWIPFMFVVIEKWPKYAALIGLISAVVFGAAIHFFFEWYWPWFCERHPPAGRRTP